MAPSLPAGVRQSPRSQKGTVSFYLGAQNPATGDIPLVVELPITPEEIVLQLPSRQQVSQTLTGAYQDHLGAGVAMLHLRGHTGWRGNQQHIDGRAAMDALATIFAEYDRRVAKTRPSDVAFHCLLDVPDKWQSFRVSKNTLSIQRSRSAPLLFRYEVDLTVLEDLNASNTFVDPSPNFVINLASPIPLPQQLTDVGGDGDVQADQAGNDGSGVTQQTGDPYEYVYFDVGTTLAQAAAAYYGPRGFANPASLWPFIALANPSLFPPSHTTADSIVPTGNNHSSNSFDTGTRIRMPVFDPNNVPDPLYVLRANGFEGYLATSYDRNDFFSDVTTGSPPGTAFLGFQNGGFFLGAGKGNPGSNFIGLDLNGFYVGLGGSSSSDDSTPRDTADTQLSRPQ